MLKEIYHKSPFGCLQLLPYLAVFKRFIAASGIGSVTMLKKVYILSYILMSLNLHLSQANISHILLSQLTDISPIIPLFVQLTELP